MTFVLCGLLSSGNFSQRKGLTKKGSNALQALFPLLSRLLPARKLLREFRALGLLLLLFPALQAGRRRGGGVSGCTWCCAWWGSLSSRSTSVQREGWECL